MVVAVGWYLSRWHSSSGKILTDPGTILSVECSHEAGNATNDYEWRLVLDANGKGTFTKWPSLFSSQSVPISVPHEMPEIQKAVNASHLSQLPAQIGAAVVDHSADRMRIKTTNLDKTITIEYVQPSDENDDARSARRLWAALQRCAPKR